GETSEMAARAHRADEDTRVEEMVGEPDAIAEQRALRKRARRIDRDHADALLPAAHVADERADQRRLADTRRACDSDAVRASRVGINLADEVVRERVAILDERDRTPEGSLVAGAHAGGERVPRPLAPTRHRGNARAPRPPAARAPRARALRALPRGLPPPTAP